MTPRRIKRLGLLIPLLGTGMALLAWAQTWVTFSGAEGSSAVSVAGTDAAMPVLALSLAALACTAVLAITGTVMRRVFAGVLALAGIGVAVAAGMMLADPVAALLAPVGKATGLGGDTAIREVIAAGSVTPTLWPAVALAGGIVVAIGGALVVATAGNWPAAARKYDRDALAGSAADVPSADTRVSQWDTLTAGEDPTDEETTERQVD